MKLIRTALVGAGYIAPWHADAVSATPGVSVAAVCDPARSAADALAARCGATAFGDLEEMIAAGLCDAAHILTPPESHRDLAVRCLEAGLHVFVEKPFAPSPADCRAIAEAADAVGRRLGVNHNFLGAPAYLRLKAALADGSVGRLDCVDIVWRYPLAPLRSGPFGLWMLRAPENLLLELGPHLFAFAIDLCGPLEDFSLRVGKPITLPGGVAHHQSWSIRARAGATDVSMHLSLVEGVEDRSVSVRGVTGAARLDFARDTLTFRTASSADIVIGPLMDELAAAGQHLREGAVNAVRQLASLNAKSPYALGFRGAVASFYRAVREDAPVDARFSAASAEATMAAIETVLAQLPPTPARRPAAAPAARRPKPSALVIGGTGFIGRHLTRALVGAGRDVRVASRGGGRLFDDVADHVEMRAASLHDPAALVDAMRGVDVVYHLAKAEERSWEGYLRNDVGVAERVAEAALEAGVRRFIYTGSIASYDASDPSRTIDEDTGFAEDMSDRNLYARSKALCEERLRALQRARGLPLVIARPGIVIGAGGPLQHWGIGRWSGAGSVAIWGDGRNVLPFVLVEDVAAGLVLMADAEGIEGQSFNLIGEPMLTARDYFDAIHALLGSRIRVSTVSPRVLHVSNQVKYLLKRYVRGRRDATPTSLRDCRSRAHLSPFANARAKQTLGWRPEADREAFLRRAIVEAGLFGF